jgi:hypothetical protein
MSALAQIPYGRPSAWASASPFLDGGFLRAEKHKNSRAHDGKLILCKHIMVSHTCLSKLLSGVISAEQALADPQEVLSQCGCTTIWDVNRWIRAENRGARLRSPSGNDPTRLRSSHISQYLKADPRSLVSSTNHLKRNLWATSCLRTLLMAPASSISDVPLNEFFSKRRVSEASKFRCADTPAFLTVTFPALSYPTTGLSIESVVARTSLVHVTKTAEQPGDICIIDVMTQLVGLSSRL